MFQIFRRCVYVMSRTLHYSTLRTEPRHTASTVRYDMVQFLTLHYVTWGWKTD